MEYQLPKLEENNKYKIHFHKLYKVYLCMIISFFIKRSMHYSATFSTQKGSMPNKTSLFYGGLDTFFCFHQRQGERGFIFKHFGFFPSIKLFLCSREVMSIVNSVDVKVFLFLFTVLWCLFTVLGSLQPAA